MSGPFGVRGYYGPGAEVGDDWLTRAVCRDRDPELFYPVGNTGPAAEQTREAIKICRSCPVTLDCLVSALRFPAPDQHGIQGGLDAADRRRLLTPCRRDHERTAENLAFEGVRVICVPCRDIDTAAYWAANGGRLAAEMARPQKVEHVPAPLCKGGHRQSDANTYWSKAGNRRCRLCAADKQRAYRERQAEAAMA